MFSVTKRIDFITQPYGGYLNPDDFEITELHYLGQQVKDILPASKPIQGLAVDYLSRFLNGVPKEEAFKISIYGAKVVDEFKRANRLLKEINGLNRKSIINACKLVCYDTAFRRGATAYSDYSKHIIEDNLIFNIDLLVKRALCFFDDYGPILKSGFEFSGGYTKIVSSGDGDFLTKDTLWDFKVSTKPLTSKQTLQLLMYYILGYHSNHKEFKKIKKLGIFNPLLSVVYEIDISKIPDETLHSVSRNVLGVLIADNYKRWKDPVRNSKGVKTDSTIFMKEIKRLLHNKIYDSGFRPENYNDGIYDITTDDYWSYYRDKTTNPRPKFSRTNYIKFLKRDGFIMFISISNKGLPSLLQGGKLRRLEKSIDYYYDHMQDYSNLVLQKFSKYWDALYDISRQLKLIAPDEETLRKTKYAEYVEINKRLGFEISNFERWYEREKKFLLFNGKVHGCIVDLDYNNHIYINPFDGTITPYSAQSMYAKKIHKNLLNLISKERPEMLKSFKEHIKSNKKSLITSNSSDSHELISIFNYEHNLENISDDKKDNKRDINSIFISGTYMYDISNKMKILQSIYKFKLIEVWYDDFVLDCNSENSKAVDKEVKMLK